MGLLDNLMGGGDRQQEYGDFVNRYDNGRPDEGYDDDEVGRRYAEVDSEIDDDTYRASARDAFARMDPADRQAFAQDLFGRARSAGVDLDGDGYPDDPDEMARLTTQVRRQQPDMLTSLLGGAMGGGMGGMGGGLGGMLGGGGMGGMGGGMGGGNPLAKAALGGVAASAMKKMVGGR